MDIRRLFEAERANLERFLKRFSNVVSPDDAAQETFVALWRWMPADVASPRAYLYQTARNVVRRHKLKAGVRIEVDEGADVETLALAEDGPSPEDACIAADEAQKLRAAIDALPPLQREVLLLRRVEGLPAQEVCRRLNLNERTMQRLVQRAIGACHAALAGDGDNPSPVD